MAIETLGINQIESANLVNKNQTQPAVQKTKPYPADSVELSTHKEKKKMSTAAKVALSALGFFGAGLGTVFAIAHHRHNVLQKLYKDKLVLSNLPEHIDFKEAKTLDEAIKYAKDILGIKDVDEKFTLEALNIVNRGITDVSNANKGKLFVPRKICYGNGHKNGKYDDSLAYVIQDVESNNFGHLVVNNEYFTHEKLDSVIKDYLYFEDNTRFFDIKSGGDIVPRVTYCDVFPIPEENVQKLIKKFYQKPELMNIYDKQQLYYSLSNGFERACIGKRAPLVVLKNINTKFANYLKGKNIKIDIDELSKLSTEEQRDKLKELIKKMHEDGQYLNIALSLESPSNVIHHEMGHLQDFAKNLKQLDTQGWSLKYLWDVIRNRTPDRIKVHEVENRWYRKDHKEIEKLFKENPEKFKERYPEMHEFITDEKIQQTAGKVSEYAQSGIGEFIAETYREMLSGRKISKDVMELYKKYNGPMLP